jgi:hypothetical protein
VAFRLLGNESGALDAVQDGFIGEQSFRCHLRGLESTLGVVTEAWERALWQRSAERGGTTYWRPHHVHVRRDHLGGREPVWTGG